MFKLKNSHCLGIDITSSVVKVLELSQKKGKHRVESYGVEPLPPNCVSDGRIDNPDQVAAAIKRAVTTSSTTAQQAVVAVSSNNSIFKTVSFLASLSERDIENIIVMESDNYIPYPIGEARLDFEVLGPSATHDDEVEVRLAASSIEHVDARVQVLEQAGLIPKLVDTEVGAVENAFTLIAQQVPNYGPDLTVAIVDVGAVVTTLQVLVDNKTVFAREQAFGGLMLTEDIERHYAMSYQQADQAKKENKLPDDYAVKVLDPFKQSMASQVAQLAQFFLSTSTQYHSIDHIILAGGCASIQGVDAIIAQEMGTSTSIANPFHDMNLGSKIKIQALSNDAPSMMIACGLAMRSFD